MEKQKQYNYLLAQSRSRCEKDTDRIFDLLNKIEKEIKESKPILFFGGDNIPLLMIQNTLLLDEAFQYLGYENALPFLEQANLAELIKFKTHYDFLNSSKVPFYTFEELLGIINCFMGSLIESKSSLILTGYPQKDFKKSRWLFNLLGRLYPVKLPAAIYGGNSQTDVEAEFDIETGKSATVEIDGEGNPIFSYVWNEEWFKKGNLSCPLPEKNCEYDGAPFIETFTGKKAEYLEENRPRFFNLKLILLEIIKCYIEEKMKGNDVAGFWGECLKGLRRKIHLDDIIATEDLEKKYVNLFLADTKAYPAKVDAAFSIGVPVPYLRLPVCGGEADLNPGGIGSMLKAIFVIENELTNGCLHQTKTKLGKIVGNREIKSYFQLVGLAGTHMNEINVIIMEHHNIASNEDELWNKFMVRMEKDIRSFKYFLPVEAEIYRPMKSLHQLYREQKNYRVVIEIKKATLEKSKVVDIPEGTSWEEIKIKFKNHHDVTVSIGGKSIDTNFEKMGFINIKSDKPNKSWEFLIEVAENDGEIQTSLSDGAKVRKNKELLSRQLKEYFHIEDDPFFREEKKQKIKIQLIPPPSSYTTNENIE